jgi:hypothetical protein
MSTTQKAAAAAVALVISAGAASAASPNHSVTGRIDHINRAKHELVLRNHVYHVGPGALGANLRKGERVTIQYTDWKGHRNASSITPVKG